MQEKVERNRKLEKSKKYPESKERNEHDITANIAKRKKMKDDEEQRIALMEDLTLAYKKGGAHWTGTVYTKIKVKLTRVWLSIG
jgi:uncharacterized protein (DUF342 family)